MHSKPSTIFGTQLRIALSIVALFLVFLAIFFGSSVFYGQAIGTQQLAAKGTAISNAPIAELKGEKQIISLNTIHGTLELVEGEFGQGPIQAVSGPKGIVAIKNADNELWDLEKFPPAYIVQLTGDPVTVALQKQGKKLAGKNFKELDTSTKAAFEQAKSLVQAEQAAVKQKILGTVVDKSTPNERIAAEIFGEQFDTALNAIVVKTSAKTPSRFELEKIPGVKKVWASLPVQTNLYATVPLVKADQVWQLQDAAGLPVTGKDVKIAIIDTGVDYTHPDLGGCYPSQVDPDINFQGAATICTQAPCIVDETEIRSRDTIAGQGEPHAPNTISASCTDGSAGTYGTDESIEKIEITNQTPGAFRKGQKVTVRVTAHCFDVTDNVNLSYWSEQDGWNTYQSFQCPVRNSDHTFETTLGLAQSDGYQVVRASIEYLGNSWNACGQGDYADNDDVVLRIGPEPPAAADCRVVGGYNFINYSSDPRDDAGHGTHVASIAAGDGRLFGMAYEAKILAYKVLDSGGSGSWETVLAGINRAVEDGADVMNLSLGGDGDPDDPVSQAIDNAVNSGVVAVIAAGNSGPGPNSIGSPGTARKAITVGATYKQDYEGSYWDLNPRENQITSFSSRGPVQWTDSQGNQQQIDKPDVVAPGAILCAARYDHWFEPGENQYYYPCIDDTHLQLAGTSMAAPVVTGITALLKQKFPNYSPDQIKEQLKSTATDLGYDAWTQGSGLVNALAAMGPRPEYQYPITPYYVWLEDVPTETQPELLSEVVLHNDSPEPVFFRFSGMQSPGFIVQPVVAMSDENGVWVDANSTKNQVVLVRLDNESPKEGQMLRGELSAVVTNRFGNVLHTTTVPVRVSVRNFFDVSPEKIDFLVDNPSLPDWQGTATVSVHNTRMDKAQQIDVSVQQDGWWPDGIQIGPVETPLALGADEDRNISFSIRIPDNNVVWNGTYYGKIVLENKYQRTEIPFKIVKMHVLHVTFQSEDSNAESIVFGYLLSSKGQQASIWGRFVGSMTQDFQFDNASTVDIAHLFETPGYHEPGWWDDVAVTENVVVNGETSVTINQSAIKNKVWVHFKDHNGNVLPPDAWMVKTVETKWSADNHASLGGTCSGPCPSEFFFKYSDFGPRNRFEFTKATLGYFKEGDSIDFFQAGVSSDMDFDPAPADFIPLTTTHYPAPSNGSFVAIASETGSIWSTYSTPATPRYQTMYALSSPSMEANGGFRFYQSPRGGDPYDIQTAGPIIIAKQGGFYYNPNHAAVEQLLDPDLQSHYYGDYGLEYWTGKFNNQVSQWNPTALQLTSTTLNGVQGWIYLFETQTHTMVNHCTDDIIATVRQNGQTLFEGPIYSGCMWYSPYSIWINLSSAVQSGVPVETTFDRDYKVYYGSQKFDLHGKTEARFSVDLGQPAEEQDQNPPSIQFFRWYSNGKPSNFFDKMPLATNQLRFSLDPVGGELASVNAYRVEGSNFVPIPVTQEEPLFGYATYHADIGTNPNTSNCTLETKKFAIQARDSNDNFLQYTFEIPAVCAFECTTSGDCPTGFNCGPEGYCQPKPARVPVAVPLRS